MNVISLITAIIFFGVVTLSHAETLPPLWQTHSERIKAVQFRSGDQPVSLPVISQNQDKTLKLTFDLLFAPEEDEENMPWLRATIEHRNSDWEKENISDNEFIDGFNVCDVGYGEASTGAITTLYRHYEIDIPPTEIRPKLSGNYLLNIYTDSNTDSILLTVPFMIEENSVVISGSLSAITDIDYKKSHQQIELNIITTNIDTSVRPYDIKVYITQNFNFQDRRNIGYPTTIDKNKIVFNHKKELIFPGSNEYRRMEVTDNNIPMLHVDRIEWISPFYHQILKKDIPRIRSPYLTEYNNGGRFTIREYNSDNSDIEADYSIVHFSLDGADIPLDSQIYIEGDFTGRKRDSSNLMSWDPQTNTYYKSLLLKHGAYDYKYVTEAGPQVSNEVEGDYHETDNTYTVSIYYRIPGERYDRLAATETITY